MYLSKHFEVYKVYMGLFWCLNGISELLHVHVLYSLTDIIHRTGLETNHMHQLVVYILYSAMCVWDYFMYSAISQEN